MNAALWTVQIILAIVFAGTGILKLVKPIGALRDTLGEWVDEFGPVGVRLVGLAELAGAIGLVVPAATGVLPGLTILAAGGIAVVMAGATVVDLRYREFVKVPVTLVLVAAAVFVLWGRLDLQPL
ncbi:DoxX family protein [Gordonia sp. NPDC003376]